MERWPCQLSPEKERPFLVLRNGGRKGGYIYPDNNNGSSFQIDMSTPMPLSPLPPSERPWSIAVHTAYQKLYHIYHTGSSYIDVGNIEAHWLQQYGNAIIADAYPLLLLLTESAESESLPPEWIEQLTTEFTTLLELIDEEWMLVKDEYVSSIMAKINLNCMVCRSASNVTIPQPIYTTCTGKRGRPKKCVDPQVLHDAFQKGRRIPTTVLASVLGINQMTLKARMQEIDIDTSYDEISDEDLDTLVRQYRQENPSGGCAYIIGHLRSAHSLLVQCHRVVASLTRIDHLGQGMREQVGKKKERTRYHVPQPNHLWHIDGHHKMIAWGIVIHGVADGYSRKVCTHNILI